MGRHRILEDFKLNTVVDSITVAKAPTTLRKEIPIDKFFISILAVFQRSEKLQGLLLFLLIVVLYLYCIALYCIALLYYILYYYIILYYIIFYIIFIVLYCIVLYFIVLHCIVLYCIVLLCQLWGRLLIESV